MLFVLFSFVFFCLVWFNFAFLFDFGVGVGFTWVVLLAWIGSAGRLLVACWSCACVRKPCVRIRPCVLVRACLFSDTVFNLSDRTKL